MKVSFSWPNSLQYLGPFVRSLDKIPPEELNEDVDASTLDAVLRNRVRGLDQTAAAETLAEDREHLELWLKASASPSHPAYWVLGYLSLPGLAEHLIRPPEPGPVAPKINFEPPDGWKVTIVPFRIDLKRGRLWASIMAIDQISMEVELRQLKYWSTQPPMEATLESRAITFGKVKGKKITIIQTAPCGWKSVRYLLEVPGGSVSVDIGKGNGADFDETLLEVQLHTLAIPTIP